MLANIIVGFYKTAIVRTTMWNTLVSTTQWRKIRHFASAYKNTTHSLNLIINFPYWTSVGTLHHNSLLKLVLLSLRQNKGYLHQNFHLLNLSWIILIVEWNYLFNLYHLLLKFSYPSITTNNHWINLAQNSHLTNIKVLRLYAFWITSNPYRIRFSSTLLTWFGFTIKSAQIFLLIMLILCTLFFSGWIKAKPFSFLVSRFHAS